MDPDEKDDRFKWFGEGFNGFPKRLPDDCVEYIICVIASEVQDANATRIRLNEILRAANDLKTKLLKDYIWQRDSFDVKLSTQSSLQSSLTEDGTRIHDHKRPPHLRGRTSYGDSVADEWLVVYLLLTLSKQFPDAWIRVYDTDGEFLLIEAARALPQWLNPEIAENRTWINNGHLRLIPLATDSSSRNLSIENALAFIESQPEKLIISPFVEDEAFFRIREYPAAIAASLHHALITIPRRLATILHRYPAHISDATEAFYLRDAISLRPLSTKDTATLNFPPEDFVSSSVKFTKVGYAQLRSQIFDPPPVWSGTIPRMTDPQAEMGMKLTCGFEMLLSDPQNADKRTAREIRILLEDIDSGDESLPSNADIAKWPQTQDNEKWLDIDYNDFETELSGREGAGNRDKGSGFGDRSAQDNLRKMVSRFEDFLNDDEARTEGVDDLDDDDDDEDSSNSSLDSEEDKEGSFDEAEFEKAMKEMMGLPANHAEKSGLLDEARKLAIEDGEGASEEDLDENEEMTKVMELMERELKGHGALDLGVNAKREKRANVRPTQKPVFGPERPPNLQQEVRADSQEDSADEEIGPGDEELSSDDEEFNDVDLGLAKNMLEAFKGQAGMAGPAGNLMRALGVNMPRDEGSEDDREDNHK